MQDDDFAFLSDSENLSHALAVCEFLNEFKVECCNRFSVELDRALRQSKELFASWVVRRDDNYFWLEPRHDSKTTHKLFPYIEIVQDDASGEICPNYGYELADQSEETKKAGSELAKLMGCEVSAGFVCELVPDFPYHDMHQSLIAIIGENGKALAYQMACKAVDLTLMLEKRSATSESDAPLPDAHAYEQESGNEL